MNRFLLSYSYPLLPQPVRRRTSVNHLSGLTDPLKDKKNGQYFTQVSLLEAHLFNLLSITIKGESVKVYPTGAFVYECRLDSGKNEYLVQAMVAN